MRVGYTALIVLGLFGFLIFSASQRPAPSFEAAIEAACDGQVEVLRAQIELGLDVNKRQDNGLTLLMCAACLGETGSVHALLQAGADVNATTPRGWTALMMAATNGHVDSARLLLRAGANPNLRSDSDCTARTIAEERAEWDFVELLATHTSRSPNPGNCSEPELDPTSNPAQDEPNPLR